MTQKIQLTDGCKRQCAFCYGHNKGKIITYPMPEITERNIEIIDQNILWNPEAKKHLRSLQDRGLHINLVQGVDYRLMTEKLAQQLHRLKIKPLRFAWDWSYKAQVAAIWRFIKLLDKVGYRRIEMQIFMLTNWKIPMGECKKKLQTMKHWNIQVSTCHYIKPSDHGRKRPHYWDLHDIAHFKRKARNHNIMCRHNGIQVEYLTNKKRKF